MQAISNGGDVLRLVGKYTDFSAEETFFGDRAIHFLNTIVPNTVNIVDADHLDSVMAWSGQMKLAGFKFSTMTSSVLDLAS